MTNEKDLGADAAAVDGSMATSADTVAPHVAHTPWHLRTANGKLPIVREIKRPHGEASHYRAVIGKGDTLCGPIIASLDFGYGSDADEANAEFIVRACNSHDALVEALKGVRGLAVRGLNWHQQRMSVNGARSGDEQRESEFIAAVEALDAAIAKAEAK